MLRSVTTAAALAHGMWGAMAEEVSLCGKTYSHSWETKASMLAPRSDMTATTVSGSIYLVGGCSADQTWKTGPYPGYACGGGLASAVTDATTAYKPDTNEHVTLAKAPRVRTRHAAAEVNGMIYLFGGVDGGETIVKEVDVYNVAADSWSTLPDLYAGATTDNSAFAYKGKIYIVGGYTNDFVAQKTVTIYDPAKTGTDAWSQGPPLLQARGDFSAVLVGDSALALGGFHDGNNFEEPLDSLERLDLGAGATSWVVRKSMAVARGDKAVAVANGALHVVGGEGKNADGHSVPKEDVEVYHPDCNEWQAGGKIPSKRFRFTAASWNGSLFIFGGQGYLEGNYGSASSKYPVLATVEQYVEKVEEPVDTDATPSRSTVGFVALLLGLAASM
mmetsp:Transcript_16560/g.48032  ORF Transcript_16560/g.48032 Transcript_16560/m.48032 type:complete len:389 (-) Transcript_16560:104-1270(-)|eukprot:CAMPEP_0176055186 /NCGR_PEP_ID=MMETSP0120_2-20121206/27467_1 /TAXON_ID=160619 /ORGANISM="Kryptoperidinium foliaceum, Strain CCMP 1326" /LENGTH=388 /DNA_ID=CAMNT_0017388667 /DNA_START=54 /DNA_END=1220 /DNA_ORIENTATION=+